MEESTLPTKPPLLLPDGLASNNETNLHVNIVESDEVVLGVDSGLLITDNDKDELEETEVSSNSPEDADEASSALESEYEDDSDSSEEENEELSLTNRILQEIQDGTYTCLVCTSEIDCFSKIWSCQSCSRVYDLDCVRDWALRGSSTDKLNKNWRCPSCNVEQNTLPLKFTCWCGKVKNPDPNQLMPFSCGNPCNAAYEDCIHKCASQCHPALHPVCGAMGPMMKCLCGKCQRQLPCLITPYRDGWNCNEPCETIVCASGHKCADGGCHLGFCGECEEITSVLCYCGKHKDIPLQCSKRVPKLCTEISGGSPWFGFTKCEDVTTIFDDCGIHLQDFACQQLPTKRPECKYSPSRINSCACGKTSLDKLGIIRTSCEDPIPECESKCGKLLPCGCKCLAKCHSGACVCFNVIDVKCDCGTQSYAVPCKFIQQGYKPKCKHKCTLLLNCRRHYHKKVCCEFEQVGLKRERENKKQVRNGLRSSMTDDSDLMTMEPAHICTRTCNRLKACGKHTCEALCHIGPCGTCYESSNEDLICNCGKTIIPAPVRCGSVLNCHEQCVREMHCGHRSEPHECHLDDVNCPKCTKLVTKPCNCGNKDAIPNVLCSQEIVSCGLMCTQIKSCGHPCNRTCSESCTKKGIHASTLVCQSICQKVRKNCPHFCKQKCHADKVGKSKNCDSVRCSEEITQTCECGRITKTVKCGASILESSKIGVFSECDDDCTQAKREESLRLAFEVDGPELLESLFREDDIQYLGSTLVVYERQKTWCGRVEAKLRKFVMDFLAENSEKGEVESDVDSVPIAKRSLHFEPGSKPQRRFIKELASTYKLFSASQDPEPQRSVFVVITSQTVVPSLSLDVASRRRQEIINEFNRKKELKQFQIQNSVCNSIVVQDVFFGVTKDALQKELSAIIDENSSLKDLEIEWMQGSTYCITSPLKVQSMDVQLENELYLIMKGFKKVVREKSLAFDCKLCLVDENIEKVLKTDEQIRITEDIQIIKDEESKGTTPTEGIKTKEEVVVELENGDGDVNGDIVKGADMDSERELDLELERVLRENRKVAPVVLDDF